MFFRFFSIDTKTGISKLYKAQLLIQLKKIMLLEKVLTARQIFYSNDHLFLCGFDTDISFVKLKHYSFFTIHSFTLFILQKDSK